MTRLTASLLAAMVGLISTQALAQPPRVWLDTSHGSIILELDDQLAPITTENFLRYVNEGFYDGTVFHRVIEDFVIQGGGYDRDFEFRESTHGTIASEADNGLLNEPGAIGMALAGGDVESGRNQFYINTATNSHLDDDFTVFGQVIAGMPTVESINALPTASKQISGFIYDDVPIMLPLVYRAVQTNGFPIMPLHTASWFDPDNSGVGFNLEVTNDGSGEQGPLLIVYWYDFRDSEQFWLMGVTDFDYGESEVTVDLITFEPGSEPVDFLTPPSEDGFEAWGSLTVRFNDCRSGRFTYDSPHHGSGEVDVVRLSLPDRASCEGL